MAFAATFAAKLTAEPGTYGVTAADATQYAAARSAYAVALATVNDPNTRNKPSLLQKKLATDALFQITGQFGRMIQANPNVDESNKLALGLPTRKANTPIPAPSVWPNLTVFNRSGTTVSLSLTAGRRGSRPVGTAGLSVFSYVGPVAPTDPAQFRYEGNFTRTGFDVTFPVETGPAPSCGLRPITVVPKARVDLVVLRSMPSSPAAAWPNSPPEPVTTTAASVLPPPRGLRFGRLPPAVVSDAVGRRRRKNRPQERSPSGGRGA